MGKKLIMIVEGVIIAALVVGVVMIQGSSQSKIKSLDDEKGKLSQQYETVLSNLQKSQASLNEAINLMKNDSFKSQFPLIPESVVLEKGINSDAIANMLAKSTYTITYSRGKDKARRGNVVILGKEGDKYVGFTTRCAVSLDRPYPVEDSSDGKSSNELIILGDRSRGYDWYKVQRTTIFPEESVAAVKTDPDLSGGTIGYDLNIDAKSSNFQSGLKGELEGKVLFVNRGEVIGIEASGEWTVADDVSLLQGALGHDWKEYKCGSIGTKQKGPEGAPLGALMMAILDDKTGEIKHKETIGEKKQFEIPYTGGLYFYINCWKDAHRHNSDSLAVKIWRNKINSRAQLENIKNSNDEVEIKPVGEDDIALVYFPINQGNFFGNNQIYSLGLEHPTREAFEAVTNSGEIFGIKFIKYCEHCHQEIQQLPEKLRQAFENGRKIGIEEGKILERKELVGAVVRTSIKFIFDIVSIFTIKYIPPQFQEIALAVGQKITASLMEKFWVEEGVREVIEKEFPLLKGTLPDSLSDFFPTDVTSGKADEVIDKYTKLAGIKLGGDNEMVNKFIKDMLGKAEDMKWIPALGAKDNQEGYLLADGVFVNQLLVSLGMAQVSEDKKDNKKSPFLKEMKQSQQKAKTNKMGMWKQ